MRSEKEKRFVRQGKVKEIWDDGDFLYFKFTDNISVFDKIIPVKIPYKGATLCLTSYHWFNALKSNGIGNHFVELVSNNIMKVKRLDVIYDTNKITKKNNNYLIPLEFIMRYYVAGSLMDRIKSNAISPEILGFPHGHKVVEGEKLPEPFFEVTTKLEKVDRALSFDEAIKMSGIDREELTQIKEIILKVDNLIAEQVNKKGLIHVDGKKEFGMDEHRNIILIDTFGTADEDRFWEHDEYSKGNFIEVSKEYVRQYYRKSGYYSRLMDARKNGLPEPDIPALPADMINKVSSLYIDLYERITGNKFPYQQGEYKGENKESGF